MTGHVIGGLVVQYVLGIDLACRARHQASLADIDGRIVWHGWKFTSRPEELERLWAKIALGPGSLSRFLCK